VAFNVMAPSTREYKHRAHATRDYGIFGHRVSAIQYSVIRLRAVQVSRNGPGSLEQATRKYQLSLVDLLVLNCSVVTND